MMDGAELSVSQIDNTIKKPMELHSIRGIGVYSEIEVEGMEKEILTTLMKKRFLEDHDVLVDDIQDIISLAEMEKM